MEHKNEDVLKETERKRSRKQDSEKNTGASNLPYVGIAAAAIILTVGAGVGFYFAKSGAYRETFMPNTTINGIRVAGMSIDEVKEAVESELSGYELKLVDRTGAGEVITKDEIALRTEFDGGLEQILEMQEPMMWVKSLWTEVDYRIGTMLVYDEELLKERVRGLSIMEETNMVEPVNAYLSDYQFDTNSYEIVAPEAGTELVEAQVIDAIGQAVLALQEEVDLDAAGCYTKPAILGDDPSLTALAAELNHYVGTVVTHQFGELEEVLDGDEIHQWLTIDGTAVTLDESCAAEYVKTLAKKYNTAYDKRPFLTTYGDVVTIPGGSYGWRMNQTKETEAVLEAVKEGAVRTREPEWLQKGASHGEYDYGNTYVEVNLTGQHLFFYKDGELLVECDFVSGNAARNWSTPAGAYPLTYKQRNATLRGEDYATQVSYWMPFNGNIGLHDADWRATFGGSIYKTNGSHGCVNLPPKAAKIIFENIAPGDPIYCYHLEGTESKVTTKAGEINTSGIASVVKTETGNQDTVSGGTGGTTEATKPTETKPAETKPAETKPAETETSPGAPASSDTAASAPGQTTQTPPVQLPTETVPVETIPAENTPVTPSVPDAQKPVIIPEGSDALTETQPAGFGPGYPGQSIIGPGSTGNVIGPDPTDHSGNVQVGPGYTGPTSPVSPAQVGPGYTG